MGARQRIRREPFACGPACYSKVSVEADRVCGAHGTGGLRALVSLFAQHLAKDELIPAGTALHSLVNALTDYPRHWTYTALEMLYWRRVALRHKRALLDEESQRTGLDKADILAKIAQAESQPDPPTVIFHLPGGREVVLKAPMSAQRIDLGNGCFLLLKLVAGTHPMVALHLPEVTSRQELRIGLQGSEVTVELVDVAKVTNPQLTHSLHAPFDLDMKTFVALLPPAIADALALVE